MYGSGIGSYAQSGYLLDASYIKLKQVILGYTFPKALIGKVGLEKLRLNIAAYNLFTLSDVPKYYDSDYLSLFIISLAASRLISKNLLAVEPKFNSV